MTKPRPKRLGDGLVALLAHVDPELRERVREEARSSGRTVSDVVSEALVVGLHTIATTRARQDAKEWVASRLGVEK